MKLIYNQRKSFTFLNETYVYESKLSRIYHHFENGFFTISAFRSERSDEENLKLHEELKRDLKRNNLGFIETIGTYVENYGTPNEILVKEISVFVPYRETYTAIEFFDLAVELMYKYKQDGIVYKEADSPIYLLDKNQKTVAEFTKFIPDQIGLYYSELRYGKHAGRTYKFEGYRIPSNSIHAMVLHKEGNIF